MQAVLTDNGADFTSEEIGEVMRILNVRTCTIAGMSTFQHVLCERVHAITVSMLTKLQEECGRKNCPTLLCSANMEEKKLSSNVELF